MKNAGERPAPRPAPAELLVLQRAEELASFVLERTARWPKSQRQTLTRRVEDLVLGLVEELVLARYAPTARRERLERVNLALERGRFLLRIAHAVKLAPLAHYEGGVRRLDELGRLLYGWRRVLGAAAIAGARAEGAP